MTCEIQDCIREARARKMCTRHYQAWRTHGDPLHIRLTYAEQGRVPHGTPHGYNHHKCRCDECLGWHRPYQRKQMLAKYGVTPADFDRMMLEQGGVCAVCGQPPRDQHLSVDHCHDTGKVRGLLCGTCNRAVGLLKDSPDNAMALAAYLLQQVDVLEVRCDHGYPLHQCCEIRSPS